MLHFFLCRCKRWTLEQVPANVLPRLKRKVYFFASLAECPKYTAKNGFRKYLSEKYLFFTFEMSLWVHSNIAKFALNRYFRDIVPSKNNLYRLDSSSRRYRCSTYEDANSVIEFATLHVTRTLLTLTICQIVWLYFAFRWELFPDLPNVTNDTQFKFVSHERWRGRTSKSCEASNNVLLVKLNYYELLSRWLNFIRI